MLYEVGWQLVGWNGDSRHVAELSLEEKRDLEDYFEAEIKANRIVHWHVAAIEIQSLENLKDIYDEDLNEEDFTGG